MMIKGGIRIGGLSRISGFDGDAAAYFERAGVTDATAKQQINAFVVGIKALGLYNNMVCWPLRSSQNAGTGTTAYSLGGFGIYNGTLTNGPTWGANGITFDGTNDYIGISVFVTSYLNTLFYSGNHSSITNVEKAMYFNGNEIGTAFSASFGIECASLLSPFPDVGRTTTISGLGSGVQYSATGVFNPAGSSMARFYNGGSKVINSSATYPASSISEVNIGTRYGSTATNSPFKGTIAIGTYFNIALSDANVLSLYTLYKTTLGTGLGLP
jgi:hypothetical protein